MPTGCPNVMLLQEPIFQLQETRMFCIANFSSYTPGLPPNSLSRLGSTCSMYNTCGVPSIVIACHYLSNLSSNWSSQRHVFQILTLHYNAWVPKRFDPFYMPNPFTRLGYPAWILVSLPTRHVLQLGLTNAKLVLTKSFRLYSFRLPCAPEAPGFRLREEAFGLWVLTQKI